MTGSTVCVIKFSSHRAGSAARQHQPAEQRMSVEQKAEYSELGPGHEFPPATSTLDASTVDMYVEAVGETSLVYDGTGLVPPTAVAARALAALAERMAVPEGTIHVSQELRFTAMVSKDDTIVTKAKVSSKRNRGKFSMMTVDLEAVNQNGDTVLTGKTSFLLPE